MLAIGMKVSLAFQFKQHEVWLAVDMLKVWMEGVREREKWLGSWEWGMGERGKEGKREGGKEGRREGGEEERREGSSERWREGGRKEGKKKREGRRKGRKEEREGIEHFLPSKRSGHFNKSYKIRRAVLRKKRQQQ